MTKEELDRLETLTKAVLMANDFGNVNPMPTMGTLSPNTVLRLIAEIRRLGLEGYASLSAARLVNESVREERDVLLSVLARDQKFWNEDRAQLSEAKKVIEFYGDTLRSRCRMKDHDGGDMARVYLEKYK